MKSSRIALIGTLIYLGIFLATYALHFLVIAPPGSGAVIDIFPVLVTAPWSMLIAPVLDSFGYIAWYDGFYSSNFPLYVLFVIVGSLPAAFINAVIIYFVLRKDWLGLAGNKKS